jgi:hypothetical protein
MKTNESQSKLTATMLEAVDRLYAVFKPYCAPQHLLDVCLNCCMDEKLEAEMRRLPLRQITTRHFYQYNDSAKSEQQPAAEIKYLIPRLLELLAHGEELHHSTELYLQRLGNCDAEDFSDKERAAIDAFALCYFGEFLSQHPWQEGAGFARDDIFDVLLMFDYGGIALQPLLERWLKDTSIAATLHYISAGFYDFWQVQSIQNAFATDRARFQEELKTWMTEDSHRSLFADRILELDMSAIDQPAICYYGSRITPREMADNVFDLITY